MYEHVYHFMIQLLFAHIFSRYYPDSANQFCIPLTDLKSTATRKAKLEYSTVDTEYFLNFRYASMPTPDFDGIQPAGSTVNGKKHVIPHTPPQVSSFWPVLHLIIFLCGKISHCKNNTIQIMY